ncbi:hypothetical protein ACFOY8_15115 [Thalassospira xianhensis]|uniref:Uncharacterized protein n=1 Tax=Thalassospira xianhensis MCCC 1A02616 TaxID=1177929 RepID=A0A367UGU6_9PROT|nr:hypothetical protein [Thalassospira xianhensis]RCK07527.1 hypothetical protein TH5_00110 [Thalassospira xianhensis MCCC 1A02616]
MSVEKFAPFENEEQVLQLGELTIENRVDRVSLFGSIDIKRSKDGLAVARQLKQLLDGVTAALESEVNALPGTIDDARTDSIENPF